MSAEPELYYFCKPAGVRPTRVPVEVLTAQEFLADEPGCRAVWDLVDTMFRTRSKFLAIWPGVRYVAAHRVTEFTTLDVRRITHRWAGLRTFAADRVPVAGYAPDAEGFFWLAGQGGYGIQTGEAAGRLAASLALGKGLPSDIAALGVSDAALSPARFMRLT